jgi:ethanolamine ammonia-lyase large subunit
MFCSFTLLISLKKYHEKEVFMEKQIKKQELIYILRTASDFFEGNFPSRKDAIPDEQMREEARKELSAITVGVLNNTVLVDDEVSEMLASHLNKNLALEISHLTLGEVKKILLGKNCVAWMKHYNDGISSVAISALVKIMTNEELSIVSLKIFNSLPGSSDVTVGSRNHFGSRIQPNSAGDKEEEILFSVLDALSYGCGDVMIGLNPACDDVPTVKRLVNFLADIVKRLELPTRWCVLSDIVKLTLAREQGAKTDLGFQSLAGTSKALKGMIGLDSKVICELARGFLGLYFEIGMGLEVTNGADEGLDMRTLTSRATGLARCIGQVTGKWMVVNTVTNFIGPEVFRTEEQLFRAGLEDIVMLKLHGLVGGIDVCAPFHMEIHPERLRTVTEKIMEAGHPAFLMSIPGGIDDMLGYESTPSRVYPALCAKNAWEMTSVMKKRITELGVIERCGLPKATADAVSHLYAEYQKAGGDRRKTEELLMTAQRKIFALQEQNFDIGYGCPHKFVDPPLMKKRVTDIYDNAEMALASKLDLSVLRDISPKFFETKTYSVNHYDYVNHPETGNQLGRGEEMILRWCFSGRHPDILFVLSGGLDANALNKNLRDVLPGVRQGLTSAGFRVSDADVVVMHGRVRTGYDVGRILRVPVIIHFIGERRGTRLDTMSAYITWGYDKAGSQRFHSDMDHSCTTAVCGIDEKGKHPDIAIREIVNLVKLMFEKRCSGVELNTK